MPKCKKCGSSKMFFDLVNGFCENCMLSRSYEVKKEEKVSKKIIVRNYKGTESETTRAYKNDVEKMSKLGYYPTSQNWTPGSYGCGSFLIAFILCFLLIGFLIFIYMLIVKPDGILSVTYELKEDVNLVDSSIEKECPQCAEIIKDKAKICRFCRYEFI